MDQFYNHDDKEAEKKKTQYTTFDDAGRFTGFTVREEGNNVVVTANYKLGCFDQAVWTIAPDGTAAIDFTYNFSGVVDLMGVMFDYPEDKVLSKRWVGDGPYRVWQNRLHGHRQPRSADACWSAAGLAGQGHAASRPVCCLGVAGCPA